MSESSEIQILKQVDALALWRQGSEVWNAWVEKNPVYHVSFIDVDFTHELNKGTISFDGFKFPNGDVIFIYAQFGDANVSFNRAQFGDGSVYFDSTQFGNGDVHFDEAKFGNGNVNFVEAKFGNGDVHFEGVEFGNGNVRFINTIFNGTNLTLKGSTINGNFYFSPSVTDVSDAMAPSIGVIDFSGMVIGGFLSLGEFKTSHVVDLSNTKMGHTIQLDKTDIGYQEEEAYTGFWPLRYRKAKNDNSARCFRLLKKYAEEAKDHERKIAFFANEMRCDYGRGLTGSKLNLYLLYDWVSDYGRNFKRPALGLFFTLLVFTGIYLCTSLALCQQKLDTALNLFGHALVLSTAHTLPFTFGSRPASKDAMAYLFDGVGDVASVFIHLLTMTQGVISAIFLFLIGLALRNFFRS